MRTITFLLIALAIALPLSTSVVASEPSNAAAVVTLTALPPSDQASVLKDVKTATDGIHLALYSAAHHDVSRMLRGLGDALSAGPSVLGLAGVAFSLAASVFAITDASATEPDPVLTALHDLQQTVHQDLTMIQDSLTNLSSATTEILSGMDDILSEIAQLPTQIVAEIKLHEVSAIKDKFAVVQRAATQYARGNLTRPMMQAKCGDFAIASLFSELTSLLVDETDLFAAKFATLDHANGAAQTQLLRLYVSVIPLVTHCNALQYSMASIRTDGERMHDVLQSVYTRASWLLAPATRTVSVYERFAPFASEFVIDHGSSVHQEAAGASLALRFPTYAHVPPHAACFQVTTEDQQQGHASSVLVPVSLPPQAEVPVEQNMFCTKSVATDDASVQLAYAENKPMATHTLALAPAPHVSIIQPQRGEDGFDPLDEVGWTEHGHDLFVADATHWQRLPRVTLVADLIILQANTSDVDLETLTATCRSLGDGYDRDGDGHSRDYEGAPWTIFCVRYVSRTLREPETTTSSTERFLANVKFLEMDAAEAWTATCPPEGGFVRDAYQVSLPAKVRRQWLSGSTTVRAYAVCLRWEQLTTQSTPNQFVQRVWIDDSAAMPDKPRTKRNRGGRRMGLFRVL